MINYGENLKYWRRLKGLTLKQLSDNTKITFQNLSRWERGEVIPNIDFCVKLANYYEISLDELIGRDLPTEQERQNDIKSKNKTININQTYNF